MKLIPRLMFLIKGATCHQEKLASFELVLRNGGIAHLNLVHVFSMIPPGCTIICRSEGLAFFSPGQAAGDYAEDLAVQVLGSTIGLEIDLDKSYGENKKIWKIKCKTVDSRNITQSAKGDKRGRWTMVLAAILILEDGSPS